MIFINKKRSEAINIRSVDAAQVYKVNADPEASLYYGKAVISESLFSKWVKQHGTATNSRGMSRDFISMKFRYTAGDMSTYDLRKMYYENGAVIPWKDYRKDGAVKVQSINYRMLYRSTGKAKEGSCIFVRESLHKKYRDYLTMGLWDRIPDAPGAKIVELSAYAPLITATAADFIRIPIDSIFVAKDETVQSMRKACVVKYREGVCKSEKYELNWDAIEEIINQDGYTFYRKKQKEHPGWEYLFRTKADLKEHGYDPDTMPEKLAETTMVDLRNVYPEVLQRYFPKLGRNVIVINGIGTDVQPRLSGQDLDSDNLYVTDQNDIVELAERAYLEYPTIINAINPRAKSYTKSMEDFARMDASIAAGQQDVGESSNIAQLALSYWFDCGCNSKELEDVFIICSVLAQVAIDSAKRTYDVTVSKELNRIKRLRCMKHKPKYPTFYADILKYKDHKKPDDKQRIIKDEDVKIFNCPMDILYQIIEDGCIDRRKNKELNTKTIQTNGQFLAVNSSSTAANRHQVGKILEYVEKYDKAVFDLDDSLEGYAEALETEFKALMSELKNVKIKQETMEYLITLAFKTGGKSYRNTLLIVLYDKNKDMFLKCFKKNSQI